MARGVFAQESGAKEKNAANEAMKAKNYSEALTLLETYLKVVDYKDFPYVYNAGVVASKVKNYAAAERYFDMCITNKYKSKAAYHAKAVAQKEQKKEAEMLATLEAGMKFAPGEMKLETMYAAHFMKKGTMQAANPIANSDKPKFEAEKAKATADFKKAKEFLVQAQSLDAANQDVAGLMKQVNEALSR